MFLLFFVARAAWREVRGGQAAALPGGELTVLDPARSRWPPGSRIVVRSGTSIGREADNDVIVDEDTVSARHAVLRYDGGRWWVEDLGSTNGTFVNLQPVVEPRPVRSGDEVRFGRVAMRFAEAASRRR